MGHFVGQAVKIDGGELEASCRQQSGRQNEWWDLSDIYCAWQQSGRQNAFERMPQILSDIYCAQQIWKLISEPTSARHCVLHPVHKQWKLEFRLDVLLLHNVQKYGDGWAFHWPGFSLSYGQWPSEIWLPYTKYISQFLSSTQTERSIIRLKRLKALLQGARIEREQ